MKREVTGEKVVDRISSLFSTVDPKADPEKRMLCSAMNKYCFIRKTSFSGLEEENESETGFVLTRKLNLLMDDLPYSNRRARDQSSTAHEKFPERDMRDEVRLVGSVMDSERHGHTYGSSSMLYY